MMTQEQNWEVYIPFWTTKENKRQYKEHMRQYFSFLVGNACYLNIWVSCIVLMVGNYKDIINILYII